MIATRDFEISLKCRLNKYDSVKLVVAQLVEWLRLTPEVHGSNPVIGKLYIENLLSAVLKRPT